MPGKKKELRKRAEQMVSGHYLDLSRMTREEIERLIHELEVHQIELQLQNEELEETQQRLTEARDRYADLYDFAPTGYATINGRTNIIEEINLAACDMLRVPRKEILNRRFTAFIYPASEAAYYHCRRRAMQSLASQRSDIMMKKMDGVLFWVELDLRPARDSDRIYIAITDISERKQAEEVLSRQTSLLTGIMNNAGAHIAYLDRDFNFVMANQAYIEHSGCSWVEMISRNYFDIFPACRKRPVFRQVMESGVPAYFHDQPFVCDRLPLRGTTYWDWTVAPVKDDENQVQGLVLSLVETTERKLAEEKINRQKELFQGVFNRIPVMLFMWDPAEKKLILNNYAEDVLGWTTEEANNGDFLEKVHPDPADREQVIGFLQSMDAGWREWVITTREGAKIPGEWANVWLSDETTVSIGVDLRERKQAEQELLRSESRYRMLFDSIDEGFCIIEMIFDGGRPADYRFLEINPAFEGQMGLKDARGKRMREMEPAHEAFWFETYGRIAVTGSPERFTSEAKKLNRWFDVYAFRLGQPEERKVGILFRDITAQKKFEEELTGYRRRLEEMVQERTTELWRQMGEATEARKNLERVINTTPDAIVIVDKNRKILFVNPAAEEKFGKSREDLIDTVFGFPVSPETSEIRFEKNESEVFYLEASSADIVWKDRPCSLVVLRDITERRESARVIRLLSNRLLEVQEKERREIGSALHDEVGGTLTVLKLALSQVRKTYGESASEALSKIDGIINELADQIRHVSHTMRPSMLDDYGLVEALQWYIQRFEERTGIRTFLLYSGMDSRLPSRVETTAYRVVQEALTNAARYSGTDSINVEVRHEEGRLKTIIKDSGAGFDTGAKTTGTGIRGMQDMAELTGGSLYIDSVPGGGTIVTLDLPVLAE